MKKKLSWSWITLAFIFLFSCNLFQKSDVVNGGLFLPDGFIAVTVIERLPALARHLAVSENGDIFVKGRMPKWGGVNWVLRDTDNDGRVDIIKNFGPFTNEGKFATSMRIHNGYLYSSSENAVYRYKLKKNELVPSSPVEMIVIDGGESNREHIAKPIAFDREDHIYVPFGAPTDACQEINRLPFSPGMMPCPFLDSNACIWQFDANKPNQYRNKDGKKYATGIRSIVGMAWNDNNNSLYAAIHGRDGLHQAWPQYFNKWESALLPSEGFYAIKSGDNLGWPYFYYDQLKDKLIVSPEYGGDGKKEAKLSDAIASPLIGFPGHWAPNDLIFYTGNQFPERYKNGAFIAFHGSTNRSPFPQSGYVVVFIPFKNGKPQKMEIFADGFAGVDIIKNVSDAKYRPMGLATGPDGSLYISDSEKGRIWKIMYHGDKKNFGQKNLEKMQDRETKTYIKTPDSILDNMDKKSSISTGAYLYKTYCGPCHQQNGFGDKNRFPSILNSACINGDKSKLIGILLNGLNQKNKFSGKSNNYIMPKFNFLKDQEIADLLTYIRTNFDNNSDAVKSDLVKIIRNKLPV